MRLCLFGGGSGARSFGGVEDFVCFFGSFFGAAPQSFEFAEGFFFFFVVADFGDTGEESWDEVCLRDVVFAIPIVGVVVDAHEEGAIVPDFGLVSRSDDEVGWVIDIGIDFWCDDL